MASPAAGAMHSHVRVSVSRDQRSPRGFDSSTPWKRTYAMWVFRRNPREVRRYADSRGYFSVCSDVVPEGSFPVALRTSRPPKMKRRLPTAAAA